MMDENDINIEQFMKQGMKNMEVKKSCNKSYSQPKKDNKNVKMLKMYQDEIIKSFQFIASHVKLIKDQHNLQAVLFSRVASLTGQFYEFYDFVDDLQSEKGGQQCDVSTNGTPPTNVIKASVECENTGSNSKVQHDHYQALEKDNNNLVQELMNVKSILENDNRDDCTEKMQEMETDLESLTYNCYECENTARTKAKELNAQKTRFLQIKSKYDKWVRKCSKRCKEVTHENEKLIQSLNDRQSALNQSVAKNVDIIKENQNLRQALSESNHNLKKAEAQLENNQVLLNNSISSNEILMSEIKKLKERMLILNNVVNARTQDAINSANNFNELTKQCDHLKNGWKESQQKYELQTKEFQEVLKKLKEYELLLNDAKA